MQYEGPLRVGNIFYLALKYYILLDAQVSIRLSNLPKLSILYCTISTYQLTDTMINILIKIFPFKRYNENNKHVLIIKHLILIIYINIKQFSFLIK
jgi:hypothetical protein